MVTPATGEPDARANRSDRAPDPPMLVLPNPVLFRCHDGHFESVNHDGDVRLALSADELVALAQFRLATDTAGAYAAYAEHLGPDALSEPAFHDLVRRALDAQLLVAFHPDQGDADRQAHQAELMRQGMRAKAGVTAAFDRFEAADAGDASRVPVIGVHTNWASAPAGLGAVLAHAQGFDDGALHSSFDFRPRLVWDEVLLRAAAERARRVPVLELRVEPRREHAAVGPREAG